jgi:hypothetical protein
MKQRFLSRKEHPHRAEFICHPSAQGSKPRNTAASLATGIALGMCQVHDTSDKLQTFK